MGEDQDFFLNMELEFFICAKTLKNFGIFYAKITIFGISLSILWIFLTFQIGKWQQNECKKVEVEVMMGINM